MVERITKIDLGIEIFTDTGKIFRRYDSGNWLFLRGRFWERVEDESKIEELEALTNSVKPDERPDSPKT